MIVSPKLITGLKQMTGSSNLTLLPALCLAFVAAGCIAPVTPTWYLDSDADGYGDSSVSLISDSQPSGYVPSGTDCNDSDAGISPAAAELYDGIDNNCNGEIDEGFGIVTWYADTDSDGYGNNASTTEAIDQPAGYVADNTDCNDNSADVNPGADEIWDGIDNNCNGQVDEGIIVTTWYYDGDTDGYGDSAVSTDAENQPANFVADDSDCNDSNSNINPGAAEISDGIDNNCDGFIDEGFSTWYQDSDSDGFGNAAVSTEAVSQPTGYVGDNTDCNDGDGAIYPGAAEVSDGIDNDCDGQIDEGYSTWYQDSDSDGYGNPAVSTDAVSQPGGYVADNTDCNDNNGGVNPGAAELYDSIDNDCDGNVDEGFSAWYRDSDNDNYGDSSDQVYAVTQPNGYVADSTDCDDSTAAANPGATEVSDGIDNDCDGQIDEGYSTWYRDADSDSYGNASITTEAVSQPSGYVSNSTDCNDSDGNINPGATEVYDSIDNNCDGNIDEGFAAWYRDSDSDGYGDANDSTQATSQPAGYVADSTDCDDTTAAANPGATEISDGIDNDCDGSIDEGFSTYYRDADSDGYGNASVATEATSQPAGYVTDNTDCNDSNAGVNPGETEIFDSIDNDCDGQIDEGFSAWYRDSDNDGYGDAGDSTQATTQPSGYVADSTDCNDSNGSVNPGATEIFNSIDDDCDGSIDEGFSAWYRDADSDGYGDVNDSSQATSQPNGYVADNTDCNDSNGSVNPGATEVYNSIDDDCDGGIDEGFSAYYRDADSDGYGDAGDISYATSQPSGYVSNSTDCNDNNGAINPGANEVSDGVDNNCNGQVDEGFSTYYQDADNDGYGNASVSQQATTIPSGYVLDNTDCNDTTAAANPGASEIYDGIDNDCDGGVDEGFSEWFRDADSDGYGNSAISTHATTQPSGYVADATDCDDSTSAANPGASEIYDGIDNDCDGSVDENFTEWFRDADSDNYGNAAISTFATSQPAGYVANSTDCNDSASGVNPGASEIYNSIDDDCDGQVDEGFSAWYRDADSDGYGDVSDMTHATSQPNGYVADATDCDDSTAAANPGAAEIYDGIDNDCDGGVDEGFSAWYRDSDNDSYGDAGDSTQATSQPSGYVSDNTDCNDSNGSVNPGATEAYNSIDDDCDGSIDEGFSEWFRDADSDNYGNAANSTFATSQPAGYVADSTDCNDSANGVNPGATEVYNSIDDNCNGSIDEGFSEWFRDADSDGYGNAADSTFATSQPAGHVADNTDCNDTTAAANPSEAEVYDGIDNDCDGGVDEGFSEWFRDADSDGYGNSAISTHATSQPSGYVADSTDCNDSNANANPGETEAYDGIDNDCDGGIDEGFSEWFRDADSDGYGNAGISTHATSQPTGYVADNTDCNDGSAAANPGETEVYDSIDNDCDGQVDEGFNTYYQDSDNDGYGNVGVTTQATSQPAGYVADYSDCNDANAAVNPAATEIYNSIDDNCDGNVDEGAATWYRDADTDGFGDSADSVTDIGQPSGYVDNSADCDDSDGNVNPNATEVFNGIDDDCNGQIDEGIATATYYYDGDNDSYGDETDAGTVYETGAQPAGYILDNTDCNDADGSINPGATDTPNNGIDEDCDGSDAVAATYDNDDLQAAWDQYYTEILCYEGSNGCTNPDGTGTFSFNCPGGGNVSWPISASDSTQTFNACTLTLLAGTWGNPNPSDPLAGITLTVSGSLGAAPDGTTGTIRPEGTVTITGDMEGTVYDVRDVHSKVPNASGDHPFYMDVTCTTASCAANAVRYTATSIVTIPYSGNLGPVYGAGVEQ